MTRYLQAHTVHAGYWSLQPLWSTIRRVVRTWYRRYQFRSKLAQLDAHLLDDIGWTVHDAACECRKPFWRA